MPGPTLPNMSIILPAIAGDSGVWDGELNAGLTLIDAHDHTAGKGLPIKTAAISINADLSLAGFALTNVADIALSQIAAPVAGARVIYVDSTDHELYWRTNAGVNVKLTSGNSLNVSLIGGIGGDYTVIGASVAYDTANSQYTFKQQGAPAPWAYVSAADVRLHSSGSNSVLYVGLKMPPALAASWTITMPLAAPVSTAIVQMDAGGVLTASNTITQPITLSGGVAGVTSFTTEIDVPTIVASLNYKHSYTKSRIVCAAAARNQNGSVMTFNAASIGWNLGVAVDRLVYPLPVEYGDRIVAWRLQVNNLAAAGTFTARLYKKITGPGAESEVALGTAATTSAFGGFVTLGNTGLSIDCLDQIYEQYYIVVTGGGSTGDISHHAVVDVKRP